MGEDIETDKEVNYIDFNKISEYYTEQDFNNISKEYLDKYSMDFKIMYVDVLSRKVIGFLEWLSDKQMLTDAFETYSDKYANNNVFDFKLFLAKKGSKVLHNNQVTQYCIKNLKLMSIVLVVIIEEHKILTLPRTSKDL